MSHEPSARFPDVGKQPFAARVSGGIGFALAGVGLTLQRPELRWPALASIVLNLVVYGALAALGWYLVGDVGPDPTAYEGWLRTLMEWARGALRVALLILW